MLKHIALLMLSFHVLFAGQKVLKSDNINIFYPEKREQLAHFTLNTIRNRIPPLQKVFGDSTVAESVRQPTRRNLHIHHRFSGSLQTDRRFASARLDRCCNHFPQTDNRPEKPRPDQKQPAAITIEHEFIHLYQSMFVPLNITPTWFNEGWACYLASPYDIHSRIILSRAILNNQIIPLEKLADFLKYNRLQAELAYAESSSLIEYLIVVYGERIMGEIFKDMALTKDFDKTLQRLTDLDTETLEYHWKRYIAIRKRWNITGKDT